MISGKRKDLIEEAMKQTGLDKKIIMVKIHLTVLYSVVLFSTPV